MKSMQVLFNKLQTAYNKDADDSVVIHYRGVKVSGSAALVYRAIKGVMIQDNPRLALVFADIETGV